MNERYEIVPGESIGPFKLGMTRGEIEALDSRPLAPHKGMPRPGVVVLYDDEDRCCKILATFSTDGSPPVFTLLGQMVNGMTDGQFAALLRTAGADVQHSYAAAGSRSAGILAAKWERTDDHIMSIAVMPRTYLEIYGFQATDIHQLAETLRQTLDLPLYQKRQGKKGPWYTSEHVQATLRALREGKKTCYPRPSYELVSNDPGARSNLPGYAEGGDCLLRIRARAEDLDRFEQKLRDSGLAFVLVKGTRR
jgi:hypothetical protein